MLRNVNITPLNAENSDLKQEAEFMEYSSVLQGVIKVADEASERVLHIYQTDFKVDFKDDNLPTTTANMASHEVNVSGLRNISRDIPILSEEGVASSWEERRHWCRSWLVDPIDGTKDFTQRTGEPVLGVVTAPAQKEAFLGVKGQGAFKRDRMGVVRRISVAESREIKRGVASKNHLNEATQAYPATLGDHELLQAGSSLKFCNIAEGRADIYPRLGPTSEWDTAAAHAVLSAAGGKVTQIGGEPLFYGKENVANPHFIALGGAP